MIGLTPRQALCLAFVEEYLAQHGVPPALRDICAHMGIRSTNGVSDHLRALERKGYIEKSHNLSRGLRVRRSATGAAVAPPNPERAGAAASLVPVYVRALEPATALDFLHVDAKALGLHGPVAFAFVASGRAMEREGIREGDYVFIRRQLSVTGGQIVLVNFGEDAALRIYRPRKDWVEFATANPDIPSVMVRQEDFRIGMILGAAVGVYRRVWAIDRSQEACA